MTTSKTNVQSANVQKENATIKANEFNYQNMIKSFDKSIFVSSVGQSKENIYKKDIFKNLLTEKEIKTQRRQLRNVLESFYSSAIHYYQNNKVNQLKVLLIEFDKYYKSTYVKNDYSIESLCSANSNDLKKDNIKLFLEVIKKHKTIK